VTIAELTEIRDTLKTAYLAAISGKSYSLNLGGTSRTIGRQDIKELRSQLRAAEVDLQQAQAGRGIPTKFIAPVFK